MPCNCLLTFQFYFTKLFDLFAVLTYQRHPSGTYVRIYTYTVNRSHNKTDPARCEYRGRCGATGGAEPPREGGNEDYVTGSQ